MNLLASHVLKARVYLELYSNPGHMTRNKEIGIVVLLVLAAVIWLVGRYRSRRRT